MKHFHTLRIDPIKYILKHLFNRFKDLKYLIVNKIIKKSIFTKRFYSFHLKSKLNAILFDANRFLKNIINLFIQKYAKELLIASSIILFISVFPSPFSFPPENLPYYGSFQWKSLTLSKLSAGDFFQNGRGGLELLPPKLRLIKYKVKHRDTLWGISKKFGVDPDSIISSNSLSNVHKLSIGETIYIPNIRGIFVFVNNGDTIYKLSTRYKVSTDLIMEVNNLESPILAPGMRVFLPGVKYNIMKRAFALGEAFDKPVSGRLTSRFGYRRDPFSGKIAFHTGIDIANRLGSVIHAARDGRVTFIGLKGEYGLVIQIKHNFGYRTVYAHLLNSRVRVGQKIKRGQIIGFMGNSGRSTGPHLHFEVWLRSRLIDPMTQTNMSVR